MELKGKNAIVTGAARGIGRGIALKLAEAGANVAMVDLGSPKDPALTYNLAAHGELGGILMSHETYSLVKEMVLAEERDPIHAKGIAKPVRNYKILERIDDMVGQGKAIREEQDGLRVLLDLQKLDKARAIKTLESILSRLRN